MNDFFCKLNGWQRIWVVLSIVWLGLIALLFFSSSNASFIELFMIWAIPCGLLYGAGLAVKWILAGFWTRK